MRTRYTFAAAGDDRMETSWQRDRLVQPVLAVEREPPKKKGIPPAYARIDRNVYLLLILIAALAGVAWWAIQHKRAEAELARAEGARATATENARRHTIVAAPAAGTPPAPQGREPTRHGPDLTDHG